MLLHFCISLQTWPPEYCGYDSTRGTSSDNDTLQCSRVCLSVCPRAVRNVSLNVSTQGPVNYSSGLIHRLD